jgi:hypothetical protein
LEIVLFLFDNNPPSNELLKVMLKKIFKKKWFIWTIHVVIVLGLFSNGFYVLENFKVTKSNQLILDQKTQLEQDKKNLMDQNSFEFLDTYKDKIIKKAGFKIAGEEVIDLTAIDLKKDKPTNQQEIPNYTKWQKCLLTTNLQDKTSDSNEQVVVSNLCR